LSVNSDQELFNKISDKNLIEGLRCQDDKVLNWLYDNYLQDVKNHVRRNSGSDEDASDVFQEAIIILYKNILQQDFSLSTDLKGYFFGIARNIWNAQLRYKRKVAELDMDIAEESDIDEVIDPVLERIVSRSFQKLKPDCQTVLNLFSEGCSYGEIAQKMGLKNETYARRKKYLCKEALMEIIKDDQEYKEFLRFNK
jgi:RNA polymerase sigma factor (sigma-70 family)